MTSRMIDYARLQMKDYDRLQMKDYTRKLANAPREGDVGRIVLHTGEGDNVKYIIRWCAYILAQDSIEPPEHVLEHFFTRFW